MIKKDGKTNHISLDELNSSSFNFDSQMLQRSGSKWNDFTHWWDDMMANTYKWYNAHPLTIYTIKRILYGLVILIIAVSVIALLVHMQIDRSIFMPPGIDNKGVSDEQLEKLISARMQEFGYSENPWVFLGNFLKNLMPFIPKKIVINEQFGFNPDTGAIELISQQTKTVWVDLGKTVRNNVATEGTLVTDIFAQAIPYSFAFGSVSTVVSFLIGVPLGVQAAKRKGRPTDNISTGISLFIAAIPALITVLGIYLLSVLGFGTSSLFSTGSFWSKFWPFVTLVLFSAPSIMVMTRRYVIDEMTADYTRFAFSQGFSENKVFYIYIFRVAGIRVLSTIPSTILLTLLGSSMLVETQWSIPGMSAAIVSAVSGSYDPYLILGYVSFVAFVQIFSSLLTDLIMVWLDPRVSLGRK